MTRIDRRALFSSGAAAALLAASGVSLDAAPRIGGLLRIALPRSDDALGALVLGAEFDTLTEIAPNGALKGELAGGWSGSEDARVWILDLREDVVFHSGRKLRAQDVVDSLHAHRAQGLIDLMSVEATGPHLLRIELGAGNPDLPFRLADPRLIICAGGNVDQPADGTGCFYTVRYDRDRHYLGRKVADHYKVGRAGWVDNIEAVVIPDAAVRAEALRDGYVDVAMLPKPDGLRDRDDLVFLPSVNDMALATHGKVGVPRQIGFARPLDDGRLAERWWML